MLEAINQGEPLSEIAPRSKFWRQLKSVAAELVEQQSKAEADNVLAAKPGFLKRLMKRGDEHVMVTAG